MPRRYSPQQKKRDWRWYVNIGLNGAVVLSMVIGTVLIFAPPQPPPVAPTIVAPTAGPTPIPTATPRAYAFVEPIPAPVNANTY
ncbi:MAG: hypothetical protein HY868_15400 [Chloroflexi bacterium]|nr:hypothetical protein [Chloroflexota bacterium]